MSKGPDKSLWAMIAKGFVMNAELDRARKTLHQERYTVKQAADALDCHEKTVREWMKQGKLNYHRPSARKTWIHRDQLADFLVRREHGNL